MTIKEFGETIEFNLRYNLKHTILGLGAPGIGKSEIISQIGKKYGYKVIDIRLAQMSEVEISGLIYPNRERTKTIWLSPEVLPDEKRDGPRTILLLDEITSCTKRVQVAAYQLILDRRIGQYVLPEGTMVIALGNREDDDGVYIRLAGPLADRFEIHYIEPDFQTWKNDYAIPHNIHKFVMDYLTVKPEALHTQIPGDSNIVFATPRSWTRVSDILKYDCNMESRVVQHKIVGNVGEKEGLQFIEYCKHSEKLVSADDFIYNGAAAPENPDELHILINGIVGKCAFLPSVRSEQELSEAQEKTLQDCLHALFRIPKAEFIVMGLRNLLQMNRGIVKSIFLQLDDENCLRFLHANWYALGMDEVMMQ